MVAWPEQSKGSSSARSEVFEEQRRVDLGDVHLAHCPRAEIALGYLLIGQKAHL
jgi:hypothetical protein